MVIAVIAAVIAVAVSGRRGAQGGVPVTKARAHEAGASASTAALGTSNPGIANSASAFVVPPTVPTLSPIPANNTSRKVGAAISITSKGVIPSFKKVQLQNDEIPVPSRK